MMGFGVLFFVMMVSPVSCFVDPFTAISAASNAIIAGSSLAGTTMSGLMGTGYSVTCGIEIENWTRFPLTHPEVKVDGGYLSVPPHEILPSRQEAMVGHKSSGTATGTYGSVSWLIAGKNRRAVVMWSAPFDFNLHTNWMGVGITTVGVTAHNNGWFNLMYYSSSNAELGFAREEYYDHVSTVLYSDGEFEIRGTMGTSHKAQAKIIVLPINQTDLAAPVKALLNKKRQAAMKAQLLHK